MGASSNPADCTHPATTWSTREGGWAVRYPKTGGDDGIDPTAGTAATEHEVCNSCSWIVSERLAYDYT